MDDGSMDGYDRGWWRKDQAKGHVVVVALLCFPPVTSMPKGKDLSLATPYASMGDGDVHTPCSAPTSHTLLSSTHSLSTYTSVCSRLIVLQEAFLNFWPIVCERMCFFSVTCTETLFLVKRRSRFASLTRVVSLFSPPPASAWCGGLCWSLILPSDQTVQHSVREKRGKKHAHSVAYIDFSTVCHSNRFTPIVVAIRMDPGLFPRGPIAY